MDHKTFIEMVCKAAHMDIAIGNQYLAALNDIIEEALVENDSVCIPSFGNFEARKRNERIMTHPSEPGKRLLVPPKVVVSFKPSSILKTKLNES